MRHTSGSTEARWALALFGGLLLAAPFCPVAAVAYPSPAMVQAVPTCRGVPATIVGTPADDFIDGTRGDDVIVGGGGTDNIYGREGDDLICAGPSAGTSAAGKDQWVTGGPGDDTLLGGSGRDLLIGSAGADLLIGRPGDDYLFGGAGTDTLRGGPGADSLRGEGGSDDVYGGRGPDFLHDPDGGNNTLRGGPAADEVESGPGNDSIRGGSGRDTASYAWLQFGSHCNDITADLSAGTASGDGFGTDTLETIENVWTGGGNDVLIGDDGPNEFYVGVPCEDEPSPTESVSGNGGPDRIRFDLSDRAELEYDYGPVEIDLQAQTARLDNHGLPNFVLITLASVEHVTGTGFADAILGDAGPNSLAGARGNDLINGREGDDQLHGDKGDDSLDGGPGANHIDGGRGDDTCLHPSQGSHAVNCET